MRESSWEKEQHYPNKIHYYETWNLEQRKKIYDKSNANEEQLRKDVVYLMEWLEQQPHLPKIKDETLLSNMLLRCKNRLEKCKNTINNYYIFRAKFPDYFSRDISSLELKTAMLMLFPIPMPKLTVDGDRFVVWRVCELYKSYPIQTDEYCKLVTLSLDVALKADKFGRWIMIVDCENMSIPLITTIAAACRKLAVYYNDIAFTSMIYVYMINCPSALEPFAKAIKFLMPKKQLERFHIVGKNFDIAESFSECKSVISSTYGGLERPIDELQALYYDYLVDNLRDWLIAESEIKADLSKIPADMRNSQSLFGADGSFRQLTFD